MRESPSGRESTPGNGFPGSDPTTQMTKQTAMQKTELAKAQRLLPPSLILLARVLPPFQRLGQPLRPSTKKILLCAATVPGRLRPLLMPLTSASTPDSHPPPVTWSRAFDLQPPTNPSMGARFRLLDSRSSPPPRRPDKPAPGRAPNASRGHRPGSPPCIPSFR
jgi:hypothetical protein